MMRRGRVHELDRIGRVVLVVVGDSDRVEIDRDRGRVVRVGIHSASVGVDLAANALFPELGHVDMGQLVAGLAQDVQLDVRNIVYPPPLVQEGQGGFRAQLAQHEPARVVAFGRERAVYVHAERAQQRGDENRGLDDLPEADAAGPHCDHLAIRAHSAEDEIGGRQDAHRNGKDQGERHARQELAQDEKPAHAAGKQVYHLEDRAHRHDEQEHGQGDKKSDKEVARYERG